MYVQSPPPQRVRIQYFRGECLSKVLFALTSHCRQERQRNLSAERKGHMLSGGTCSAVSCVIWFCKSALQLNDPGHTHAWMADARGIVKHLDHSLATSRKRGALFFCADDQQLISKPCIILVSVRGVTLSFCFFNSPLFCLLFILTFFAFLSKTRRSLSLLKVHDATRAYTPARGWIRKRCGNRT